MRHLCIQFICYVSMHVFCFNMASRKKNQWSTAQLHAAIKRVKTKELSLRQAAVLYGIPRSTLSDHVHGKSTK